MGDHPLKTIKRGKYTHLIYVIFIPLLGTLIAQTCDVLHSMSLF